MLLDLWNTNNYCHRSFLQNTEIYLWSKVQSVETSFSTSADFSAIWLLAKLLFPVLSSSIPQIETNLRHSNTSVALLSKLKLTYCTNPPIKQTKKKNTSNFPMPFVCSHSYTHIPKPKLSRNTFSIMKGTRKKQKTVHWPLKISAVLTNAFRCISPTTKDKKKQICLCLTWSSSRLP